MFTVGVGKPVLFNGNCKLCRLKSGKEDPHKTIHYEPNAFVLILEERKTKM